MRGLKNIFTAATATLLGGLLGVLIGMNRPAPTSHDLLIKARQYAYEPSSIEVNKGDTLNIRLVSLDVVHGFFVEGYDIDARIYAQQKKFKVRHPDRDNTWKEVDSIQLITDRAGKYRFRCSHTCGTMHPFMQGEMIVQPNSPYHAGVGGIFGLFAGMIFLFFRQIKERLNIELKRSE
jgi:cytochrome c oxidase subunit 2